MRRACDVSARRAAGVIGKLAHGAPPLGVRRQVSTGVRLYCRERRGCQATAVPPPIHSASARMRSAAGSRVPARSVVTGVSFHACRRSRMRAGGPTSEISSANCVGHGGGGLGALAFEEELLHGVGRLGVAHAAHQVGVEVLALGAHAADVEGQHPFDRHQRLLEVVVHVRRSPGRRSRSPASCSAATRHTPRGGTASSRAAASRRRSRSPSRRSSAPRRRGRSGCRRAAAS